jgi:imidazolonepropionase
MQRADLIVANIGELVTVSGPNRPRLGQEMQELGILQKAALAIRKDKIAAVGAHEDIITNWQARRILDAQGLLITPGLVDPHTHPVFAASRENEFDMRIKGATYQQIAEAGGGIRNSVRRLREMPKEDLKKAVLARLDRFLKLGTTTIEAKSGYGLSLEAETKSLEILQELAAEHPIGIVPTFLGAHEVPDEYRDRRAEYVRVLIEEMIPVIAEKKLARYCDIFCEKGVFEIEESRKILEAARRHGLGLKLHADEFARLGGAELAAEVKAISADHLMAVSEAGIAAMKTAGVVAVLLPATTFFLRGRDYAPARKMIEAGVAVALATDFNPGSSMTQSLRLTMTIACLYLEMYPAETLVATTINSACAIGMEEKIGSLMPGKQADIVIWDATDYRYLPYHFGDNLVKTVIKSGKIIK